MNVLERARANQVTRVAIASSTHALGGHVHRRQPGTQVSDRLPPHPCCLYGATKVFGEAAGRVIADSGSTTVVALRLGGCRAVPPEAGWLPHWLAPADLAQLIRCALRADVRYGAYLGVSANTGSPWDISETTVDLGFAPEYNSEIYRDRIPQGADTAICAPRGE
jgi:uronate dehydrogenase